jgi:hypothetical protein
MPGADVMDAVLHAERIGPNRQKVTYTGQLGRLPPGTMVTLSGSQQAYLVGETALFAWHPGGYGPPSPLTGDTRVRVLTPRSIVWAIPGGFRVGVHSSAATGHEVG